MSTNIIEITAVGNLTRDPALRFIASGQAVCDFGIAVTSKKKEDGQFVDDNTSYYKVTAWADLAENVATSLVRGNRVIVSGKLEIKSFQKDDGTKVTTAEITAEAIGPDLRFATAEIARTQRSDSTSNGNPPAAPAPAGAAGGATDEPF